MNASELAAVYERLWAAVPATRPKDLFLSVYRLEEPKWWFQPSQAAADYEQQCGAYENICTDEAAAALCRVAAEDWLEENCPRDYWTFGKSCNGGYYVNIVGLSYGEISESDVYEGPTIHHALVLACLAVHNASPSPAPPS